MNPLLTFTFPNYLRKKLCALSLVLPTLMATAKAEEKPAAPADPFEVVSLDFQGKPHPFRLLKPEKIDPAQKYPCILFLHGAGERGDNNTSQLVHFASDMAKPEMRAKYPCFLIAVQCRPNQQWVDAPWGDRQPKPMADEPNAMLQTALAALDKVCKEQPVDEARIIVTGLSMGGYGTWELAMRKPERFSCAVPICGGGDESKAALLKNLPIWAWHGEADNVVWPERSKRMVDAVNAAGGKAKLTILPGVGHLSWGAAYAPESGLLDWMFAQKCEPRKP